MVVGMTTALLQRPKPIGRAVRDKSIRGKARRLIMLSAIGLLPWASVLATTLPSSTHVRNWSTAWVGLDLLLAAGCGLTAILLHRNDSRARLTASAVAGAALIDLWFDVITAEPGGPLAVAMLCAVAEFGLIAACMHVALATPEQPE